MNTVRALAMVRGVSANGRLSQRLRRIESDVLARTPAARFAIGQTNVAPRDEGAPDSDQPQSSQNWGTGLEPHATTSGRD
ncbi:MAG: hypothetical protein ABI629_05690 [bacterium]